jgi:serine/threonine protein kinase/Tol biopolymer transport system component
MIGQVLGHYRILEKIGSGGMGDVYRAHDDQLDRDVAVKILKSSSASDHDRLRRFEQEARAAAALNHPNIVAIYGNGIHEGAPYIVSELLQGQTLRQKLLTGPLPVRQAADYGRQIASGLVAAHERRIVHRDLKPENLFITRDGHLKILDFGIAKLTAQETSDELSSTSLPTQTKVGTVLGTSGYMSPEQLRVQPVDHRSDIFSLGAILYEMLSGVRAFSGGTEVDTMTAVLNSDPPELTEVRPSVPLVFDQIVRRCLEKEPENRFQSARDLAFALSTVTGSTARQILPPNTTWAWLRKRLPWIATAAVLAGIGIFLGRILAPAPNPQYRRITFERGTVYSARFRPDGRSVLYGAAWNGQPTEIYSTVGDSPQAQSLGLSSAYLLGVSRENELAIALRWEHGAKRDIVNGVLARTPLAGGTPREVLEDVRWADWGPNGELAVVHHIPGHTRLEFPIGTVLYETSGWITNIRFSPKGDRIGFMDHPAAWDDRGTVCAIDLKGKKTTLTQEWQSEDGLAWAPNGDEIWFTAAANSISNRELWTTDLSGHIKRVLSIPGGFTLHDIASDGRVLISMDTERLAMEWAGADNHQIQDLSWYDWSIAKDISRDGKWVLFEEGGAPAGPNYAVSIRKTDGSPPIRLGDGTAGDLSPDGKWALAIFPGTPQHITLLPVGAGQPREIPLPGLEHLENGAAFFMPDGKQIVVNGNERGHSVRSYLVNLSGSSAPRPITPEATAAGIPSPDGKYVVGTGAPDQNAQRKLTLYPVAGGTPIELPTTDPPYVVCQWADDSRAVYIYRAGEMPVMIYRLDIKTGKMSSMHQLIPANRAGVISIGPVISNLKGTEFAYSSFQTISVMYVVSGLR